jgi:TorA maturation chaperone TorD
MTMAAAHLEISEEDRLRADLYDFLGSLLSAPPPQSLIDRTAALTGDKSPLGEAVSGLSRVAGVSREKPVRSEFNALFIGLGRGELLPYASYYLTGFLNEKPLAQLRGDMAANGISRAENVYEPEDNIASLMEMMAGMILGRFGAPAGLDVQRTFWNRHVGSWAGHFYSDLEAAKGSVFYAGVGAVGRVFMEIEREAFRMTAG